MLYKPYKAKGFTLVELLIVVIILAILAAIVVPQFASSTDDAKISALDSTLANMRSAIDLYYQQHSAYPGAKLSSGGTCAGTAGTGAADSEAAILDQLAYYTNAAGLACTTKSDGTDANAYPYGPYLKKRAVPTNPVTEKATLKIETAGDLNMVGQGAATGGWRYDNITGKFIANDTNTDPNGVGYDKH